MAKALTTKQCKTERATALGEARVARVTLEYSIKFLEDYQSDLKLEVKELAKTIRKAKLRYQKMDERIKAAG